MGRPPKHDLTTWTVADDWPDSVPVTKAEIDVFASWFGDVFDEIFDGADVAAQGGNATTGRRERSSNG